MHPANPYETSTTALFRACAEGDAAARERFVRKYDERIRIWTLRTANRWNLGALAGDFVNDVYVKLFEDAGVRLLAFRDTGPESDLKWLFRVTTFETVDRCRSMTRSEKRMGPLEREPAHLSERNPLVWVDIEHILEEGLPLKSFRRDAAIFRLRYRLGFTSGEIARSFFPDLSEAGVESVLERSRRILRSAFGDRCSVAKKKKVGR